MACKNVCSLCKKLILSTAITYTAPNLVITIPEGSYSAGNKYCIVLSQTIPTETVVDAPVVIQVGDRTELYPLVNCNRTPVTARNVRSRTKYATRVQTSATTGVFRLFVNLSNENNNLVALTGDAPTTATPATPEA